MSFQPRDMIVWLSLIDVNGLSASDANRLAAFDIENDGDLRSMIDNWLKPQYDQRDSQNRAEMREILEQSKQWTEKQLRPVFSEIGLPSGQEIKDIDLFLDTLRQRILI
ncbi:hypothetical protein D1610_14285 [Sphingomonas gilva]|uniref:Uncharacterized protein n=1 Tax=Sphingomonas gilva TaxID=2305907 RepID=A0A396RRE7_9SPHN|nr:hypothetical protein [Sphingomonas gilva]RHW16873.1 hypothetical protein D1610_14285 [Sphingomonas gilva]